MLDTGKNPKQGALWPSVGAACAWLGNAKFMLRLQQHVPVCHNYITYSLPPPARVSSLQTKTSNYDARSLKLTSHSSRFFAFPTTCSRYRNSDQSVNMRSFVAVAAAATLFSSVQAAPWRMGPFWWGNINPAKCLTQASVDYLTDGFAGLISAYSNENAQTLLSDDFIDYSDSINSLIGAPVGVPTFPNKAAFMAGQGAQPPVPMNITAIEAFNCDTISLRWTAGLQPEPVKGMTVLKASNAQGQKDTWQISVIFTEFNSISWLKDIGGSVTLPQH